MLKKLKIISFFLIILTNCSLFNKDQQENENTIPKKEVILDPQKKAKEFVKKGGGILGSYEKNRGSTTYNFATSNVMWRATLSSLKFMPLQSIDYGGGILVTDWYSPDNKLDSKESIKITIRFLSDVVSANSFEIMSHKKICDKNLLDCKIIKLNDSFNQNIKNKIMEEISSISIKEKKDK